MDQYSFFSLPKHLEPLYKMRFEKRHNNHNFLDNDCYYLERMFFKPVIKKTSFTQKWVKAFLNCKTANKLTIEYKKMYSEITNLLDLENIEFKKTKGSKKSPSKSYYHSVKSSVYINENIFFNILHEPNLKKKKRESEWLVYVTLHELSHAYEDIHFVDMAKYSHDHFFLEALFTTFKTVTGVKKQDLLNKKTIINGKLHNLDSFLSNIAFFDRMRSNQFRKLGIFNSIEEVESQINKSVGFKLFDIKKTRNSFSNSNTIYYEDKSTDDDYRLYSDKIFIFSPVKDGFLLYEYKELKHKIMGWNKVNNILKKQYDQRNKS